MEVLAPSSPVSLVEAVTPTKPHYVYGVDLLRFVAALIVAYFHLTFEDSSLHCLWFGWIGVQVFFVISGLVIANSAEYASPKSFLRSRFLRLYPVAWICAFLNLFLLLAPLHQPFSHAMQKSFLKSFALFPTTTFLASAYWTLPIEMSFYALIFLLLLTGAFQRISGFAITLALASSTYLILYTLYTLHILNLPFLEFGYSLKSMLLLRQGIYFALGIFLWLWSRNRLTLGGKVAACIAALSSMLEITHRAALVAEHELVDPLPIKDVWATPIIVFVAFSVVLILSVKYASQIAAWPAPYLRALRIAGLTTYPLYLLHENLGGAVKQCLASLGASPLTGLLCGIVVTTLVAVLIATVLEPLIKTQIKAPISRLLGLP